MSEFLFKDNYKVRLPVKPDENFADLSIVHKLMAIRGIESEYVDSFLTPDFEGQTHNPFLLKGVDISVNRIMTAMKNNEKILVYSDFDADGLPGAAIIHDFFRTVSYENVSYIAPDRHEKGFGFHESVVQPYIDDGVSLIITIDCGIGDVTPSASIREYARSLGRDVDIIITDHHLPGPILPDVFAVINPKQSGCLYPEKMLCGAAVIYKLVCALVRSLESSNPEMAFKIPVGYEKWLLDLVGIATLSDMVPLLGENRTLAHFGLVVLRKSRRPGIVSLCETNMIQRLKMQEEDVTFTISPRINVASRLASPDLAFRLLTTDDFDTAMSLAKELNSINTKRKTMVATTMKQANAILKAKGEESAVIVVGSTEWKPPILGLVATQIIKTYKKPAFVWGRADDGLLKGSVRSVEGIDIVELMRNTREDLFVNKGGHAASGGFSIKTENILDLEQELNNVYASIYGVKKEKEMTDLHVVDLEIDIKDINRRLFDDLGKLSPFGVANERPVFAIYGAGECFIPRLFGKQNEHLEIDCGHIKAIQFFTEKKATDFNELQNMKKPIIIGQIELNQFRGASEVRIKVLDII